MLSPRASSMRNILSFTLLITFFSSMCSTLDSPESWSFNVDPYTVTGIMDFSPFLNITICEQGKEKICTEDFARELKKGNQLVKNRDSLRKGCDFDTGLNQTVCWIRKKVWSPVDGTGKSTVFELQFWRDTKLNRCKCRYTYPTVDDDE
uniref:Uncharacterized protein n=1 Tax=Cacopsylla melanoneura TaxID=428564 RepID=A0A8D8Z1Q7_9HEMI